MSHRDYILLQSSLLDSQSILNKFLNLIDNMIIQLRERQLDVAIAAINKHIINEPENNLIDTIILNCSFTRDGVFYDCFDSYVKIALEEFSVNEQFCILAHVNFPLVGYEAKEEPQAIMEWVIFKSIRYTLLRKVC